MQKFVVCLVARNENHVINEFVYHYIFSLKFDRVIIFDHLSDIPISNVLNQRLSPHCDIIRISKNKQIFLPHIDSGKKCEITGNFQVGCYKHFLSSERSKQFEWILIVDADEFLTLPQHENINDFINSFGSSKVHSIRFNWLCYGPSGHETQPTGTIMQNFRQRNKISHVLCNWTWNNFVKSMTKISMIDSNTYSQVHRVNVMDHVGAIVAPDGTNLSHLMHDEHNPPTGLHLGYIAHFISLSYEHLENKRKLRLLTFPNYNLLTRQWIDDMFTKDNSECCNFVYERYGNKYENFLKHND